MIDHGKVKQYIDDAINSEEQLDNLLDQCGLVKYVKFKELSEVVNKEYPFLKELHYMQSSLFSLSSFRLNEYFHTNIFDKYTRMSTFVINYIINMEKNKKGEWYSGM